MEIQLNKKASYPCSQCGTKYSTDEMLEFERLLICFNCKPIFIQKMREGVPVSPKTLKSKWWKIFFFVFFAFQIIAFEQELQSLLSGERLIENISCFVVYPWVLLAIYGYSFNKKFLSRKIWEVLFPVAIITDIAISILGYMAFTGQNDPGTTLLAYVVIYVIMSPLIYFQYVALYRYGYSHTEPWENNIYTK